MNFGFSEEQEQMRAEAMRFTDELTAQAPLRERAEHPSGVGSPLWSQIAQLGWCGLLVDPRQGGAGWSWVDAALLLETTGRALLPAPLLSTLLASWGIAALGGERQRERWLPPIALGECVATAALVDGSQSLDTGSFPRARGSAASLTAELCFVPDAGEADLFLIALCGDDGPLLAAVGRETPGVHAESLTCIDPTKRIGRLRLDGVPIAPENVLASGEDAERGRARLLDAGAIACAAEMVGAAEGAHALTVRYARERRQFGHPIGRFQGVKHPLAEMHVRIELARSLVYGAAWALGADPDGTPRAASMAKASATEALARAGVEAVQLHGAIGFTAEYDAQLYLKRSKWARPAFGDAAHHHDRIARLRSSAQTPAHTSGSASTPGSG